MDRETKRETVVVDNSGRRSSGVWTGVLIAAIVLLLLFFVFGGLNLFGGGASTPAPTTGQ